MGLYAMLWELLISGHSLLSIQTNVMVAHFKNIGRIIYWNSVCQKFKR